MHLLPEQGRQGHKLVSNHVWADEIAEGRQAVKKTNETGNQPIWRVHDAEFATLPTLL